jgi:spore coat protein U-like protein
MRALILILAVLAPVSAHAQAGGPLGSCRIVNNPIDFGTYHPLNRGQMAAIGLVRLICKAGRPAGARITLTPGQSGNSLDRTMVNGSKELHYNIFIDPQHLGIVGDGSNGTQVLTQRSRSSQPADTFPVFGLIPPRQSVPAGFYSDNLTIIVTF